MRHRYNFDFARRFTKYDKIWEAAQDHAASIEGERRKLTTNRPAARELRRPYHSRQPPLRVAPPGKPGLASLGRYFSLETTLGFFPGDHRNRPSIDLAQTLLDVTQPSLLGTFVYFMIEAFKQRIGKRGPPLRREQQRILQKLGGIFPHALIIGPGGPSRSV